MASGDGGNELIPGQEGPRPPAVVTEVAEATSLQKWLDGLEGAREQDQEVFAGRTISHSYEVPEENVARDIRLDNSFLKAALPKLLDGVKDPVAVDHPLAYLIHAGSKEKHGKFTSSSVVALKGMEASAKLAEKIEVAINEGNLVALEALLQSRMNYLDVTTQPLAYREYVNSQVTDGHKSMFGEPLIDSEKQELDRARQEDSGLRKASDILKDRYGVNPTVFPTWDSILKAPVGPNPTVPIAKAA